MPKSHWNMDLGWDKWDSYKKLEKVAERLAIRIAKRAFPELAGAAKFPSLWGKFGNVHLESKDVKIKVNIQLPE